MKRVRIRNKLLLFPRIPWQVVKQCDNSKFTQEEIQAEQEINSNNHEEIRCY
jgi:hypothetical protein